MKKASRILAFALLILNPLASANAAVVYCDELSVLPIGSVADFNTDGIVNGKDIAMLAKYMRKINSSYSAVLDRDGNGVIDHSDMFLATRDMGLPSLTRDQELITAYNADTCVTDTDPNLDTDPDDTNSNGGIDIVEEAGLD